MKRKMLTLPLILLVVAFASLSSATSYASKEAPPPPPPGFHVEEQMLHCINKFLPCNTPSTATNSLYTNVEVDSFIPGKSEGTPDHVVLACGYAYFDQNNNFHDVSEHVFAGFEKGTIQGHVELEGNYSKTSTHAIADIENLVATDAVTGDTSYVEGTSVVNNVTQLRVSGGFEVRMVGPIYDEYTDSNGHHHVKQVGNGEIDCNTSASYVSAPFATGPYFVAFVGKPK